MQIGNTGVIKDSPTVIRERLLNKAIEEVEGFTNLPSGIQNNLIDESVIIENEMTVETEALLFAAFKCYE